ncbi:MAG: hypothetical protein A2Y12_16405 [Planctomycetes bacterium GWF2_42_9]|nr:MAG: hypothetical protein A2Y12_16405 [Planctomycetes bacterium GWF2_42_9]
MAKRKQTVSGRWPKEEINTLKKEFRNKTNKEIAEKLNRNESSIQFKASQLGLKKSSKHLKKMRLRK